MRDKKLNEDKRERFKRVAERRVNDILEKIRILGNCANKNSYEYSEEEINKIFNEIDKLLKITKLKYLSNKKQKFTL